MDDMHDAPPGTGSPSTQSGGRSNERTWAMFAHLSALSGYLVPFGHLIGPLVVWLMKRDEMPFVKDQGRESLNFQITVSIAYLACGILSFVTCGIGVLLFIPVALASLIFIILATISASNGVQYRYPVCWRVVS